MTAETGAAAGLREAVRNGDLVALRNLVQAGVDIEQRDERGSTALHHAACGQVQLARYLLERGADTEATDCAGLTPLHVAFLRHDRLMYELLVSHGANAQRPLPDGRTPAAIVRDGEGW